MKNYLKILLLVAILIINEGFVPIKDFGRRGHVFSVIEKSMLDELKEKVKIFVESKDFDQLNQKLSKLAQKSANRPKKVEGLYRATKHRVWYIDPTYTQSTDIKDNDNKIIVSAGTSINPLEHVSWGDNLIFIDGDNEQQVIWGLKQAGKIVLTNGAPIKLSDMHDRIFYFDQFGALIKALGIQFLPSVVSQKGLLLMVEEFVL